MDEEKRKRQEGIDSAKAERDAKHDAWEAKSNKVTAESKATIRKCKTRKAELGHGVDTARDAFEEALGAAEVELRKINDARVEALRSLQDALQATEREFDDIVNSAQVRDCCRAWIMDNLSMCTEQSQRRRARSSTYI